MWSFFCHCVIEALAGFFSSVLSKKKEEYDCEVQQGVVGVGKRR